MRSRTGNEPVGLNGSLPGILLLLGGNRKNENRKLTGRDRKGLTEQEANDRLEYYGLNSIDTQSTKSFIAYLKEAMKDIMITISYLLPHQDYLSFFAYQNTSDDFSRTHRYLFDRPSTSLFVDTSTKKCGKINGPTENNECAY